MDWHNVLVEGVLSFLVAVKVKQGQGTTGDVKNHKKQLWKIDLITQKWDLRQLRNSKANVLTIPDQLVLH